MNWEKSYTENFYVSFRLNVICQGTLTHSSIIHSCLLKALEQCRVRMNLYFLDKILARNINCLVCSGRLSFPIPNRTTQHKKLYF